MQKYKLSFTPPNKDCEMMSKGVIICIKCFVVKNVSCIFAENTDNNVTIV